MTKLPTTKTPITKAVAKTPLAAAAAKLASAKAMSTSSKPTAVADAHDKKDAKPAKQPDRDILRVVELTVLSLVVISNIYFGYTLSTKGVLAAEKTTKNTTTSVAPTQTQPASIPKMVGGC